MVKQRRGSVGVDCTVGRYLEELTKESVGNIADGRPYELKQRQ